jgi:MraZ protein
MAYFSGEYECTVDAKGRMLLPSRVKVRLPENHHAELVIQKSTDSRVGKNCRKNIFPK